MTIQQRAEAFAVAFSKWPASHLRVVQEKGRDVLYGIWVCGQDYRTRSKFYGAYPHGYLERVSALFPDVLQAPARQKTDLLHIFSGSLPEGNYERCDMAQPAELEVSVYALPNIILNWRPKLVMADPPYSAGDAKEYGTPMVNRGKALRALARVTDPGRHLVWLDVCWPMHRKDEWATVGRILLQRSTNHRARVVSIFERVA
jgi:hypothetical protein